MIYSDFICSLENKHIKQIKKIMHSPKQFPEFLVVEGDKHSLEFKNSINFKLIRWFILEGRQHDFSWIDGKDITIISEQVLNYLSSVECSQGIIGFFSCAYNINNYNLIEDQPTFILDKMSDPANIGVLIRTAVALGRKQMILVDGVFPFSTKIIRASAGMIAHIKLIRMTLVQFLDTIKNTKKKILAISMLGKFFSLDERSDYIDYHLILGNEGSGIREELNLIAQKHIALPMANGVESLNASVAGSVMGYLVWGDI
jgi:TrmH family RNA methyltransferase